MKAMILNSGISKRMGDLTKNKPKCLVKVGDKTLLERQLTILQKNKITDIIITTGYFGEKIRDFVKKNFSELKVKYIYNPEYSTTNYIYSMFLTKNSINDDILLMHGDMIFTEDVFRKLINSPYENAVLLDSSTEVPIKDFKGRVKDDRVIEIGVNVFGDNCHFLAPIYKLSKEFFYDWLREIENFIDRDEIKVYAENAFNNISSHLKLKPIFYSNELCMEVDDKNDIAKAEKILKENENSL